MTKQPGKPILASETDAGNETGAHHIDAAPEIVSAREIEDYYARYWRESAEFWAVAEAPTKPPKSKDAPEGDPKRGDEILKRMLQTKPKHHKDMVAERKAKRDQGGKK